MLNGKLILNRNSSPLMDKILIGTAVKKLRLIDVVLHENSLVRNNDIDPFKLPSEFEQQSRLEYLAEEVVFSNDDNQEKKLLRVYVNLGVRAANKVGSEDDDEKELFSVKASFRAEYIVLKELTVEESQEFCKHNAVHNVWPFWRMHVFNTLKLACLPQLNIPLQRLDQIKVKK